MCLGRVEACETKSGGEGSLGRLPLSRVRLTGELAHCLSLAFFESLLSLLPFSLAWMIQSVIHGLGTEVAILTAYGGLLYSVHTNSFLTNGNLPGSESPEAATLTTTTTSSANHVTRQRISVENFLRHDLHDFGHAASRLNYVDS